MKKKRRMIKKKLMMDEVKSKYPVVLYLTEFLTEAYQVFDTSDANILLAFIEKYRESEYDSIKKYATGLMNDYAAVRNSLVYKSISNGPSEGHNNILKFKHRRCGGRAGLDLMNAYFVLSSYKFEDLYYYCYHRLPV